MLITSRRIDEIGLPLPRRKARLEMMLAILLVLAGADGAEETPPPGLNVVVHKCTACHSLARVFRARYSQTQWNEALARMQQEGLELDEKERHDVLEYLVTLDAPPSEPEHRSRRREWGKLHFAVLHFPIALLVATVLLDGLSLVHRDESWRRAAFFMLGIALLSAIATIGFGWLLAWELVTEPAELSLHRRVGTTTGLLTLLAWVAWTLKWPNANSSIWLGRIFLLLAAAGALISGHIGGGLVHGDTLSFLK